MGDNLWSHKCSGWPIQELPVSFFSEPLGKFYSHPMNKTSMHYVEMKTASLIGSFLEKYLRIPNDKSLLPHISARFPQCSNTNISLGIYLGKTTWTKNPTTFLKSWYFFPEISDLAHWKSQVFKIAASVLCCPAFSAQTLDFVDHLAAFSFSHLPFFRLSRTAGKA